MSTTPASTASRYDVERVRRDFPILARKVHGKPLVYLDNAASTQKPTAVIEAVSNFYETHNANIHRGVHQLSQEATASFETARARMARFLGAGAPAEIVFTRGTTESINLVASSYGRANVGPGDEVLITEMEHHSNIVPWQLLCEQTGAVLKAAPIDDDGDILLDELEALIGKRTKIVAVCHVSNSLGTVNPVKRIAELAHAADAVLVVDGAQAAPHSTVDVQELGADFYACSGHKMYGPTGIGVLYGRRELLDAMPPYQGGGEMIRSVTIEKSTWAEVPHKFEAGTPDIAGAIGMAAAADYLESLGREAIAAHEVDLLAYGTAHLEAIPGVRLIGTARQKTAVLSFILESAHPHDIGTIVDAEGVAVRTGHHCAQPVMAHFGVPATARASLGIYNTHEEIDVLVAAIGKVRELFS